VLRPGGVLAVVLPALLAVEVEAAGGHQLLRIGDAPGHPVAVHREHGEGRGRVAAAHRVVQAQAVRLEALDVGGGEELLVGVERLQVTLEDLLRHRVVGRARTVGIAAVRQQAVDQLGGRGLVRGGGDRDLRRDLGTREQCRGDGQQEGKQGSGGSGVHAVARAGGGRWGSGVTVTGTASGAGSCRAGGAGTGTFRRRLATAAYGKVNRNGVANGRDGAGARSGGWRGGARSGRRRRG